MYKAATDYLWNRCQVYRHSRFLRTLRLEYKVQIMLNCIESHYVILEEHLDWIKVVSNVAILVLSRNRLAVTACSKCSTTWTLHTTLLCPSTKTNLRPGHTRLTTKSSTIAWFRHAQRNPTRVGFMKVFRKCVILKHLNSSFIRCRTTIHSYFFTFNHLFVQKIISVIFLDSRSLGSAHGYVAGFERRSLFYGRWLQQSTRRWRHLQDAHQELWTPLHVQQVNYRNLFFTWLSLGHLLIFILVFLYIT